MLPLWLARILRTLVGDLRQLSAVDVAVAEAGAKLIVVVNPLVPYVNESAGQTTTNNGSRTCRVSDRGFPQIGYQTFKLFQTSVMNYTSRVQIAPHGLQSVTLKLAHGYGRFKRISAPATASRSRPPACASCSGNPRRSGTDPKRPRSGRRGPRTQPVG